MSLAGLACPVELESLVGLVFKWMDAVFDDPIWPKMISKSWMV